MHWLRNFCKIGQSATMLSMAQDASWVKQGQKKQGGVVEF